MPELYALVVRELSSCCQNVSRFCGCCLLAMTDRDVSLTLNMTMDIFACAIFVIARACPKQSSGMESFMILASHTVDCHARTLCSLAMTKGVRLKSHLRITRKSARKAMAKPQHSAALKIAIFDSPLLMILSSQPQRTAAMFEP